MKEILIQYMTVLLIIFTLLLLSNLWNSNAYTFSLYLILRSFYGSDSCAMLHSHGVLEDIKP